MESACSVSSFTFNHPTPCTECGAIFSKAQTQPIPSSIVRSYYLPVLSDTSVIEGLVSTSEVAIHTLEVELSALQSKLSNIRKFNAFHRSLLSPIRKLPTELLCKIFSHVINNGIIDIGVRSGEIWDLARVCNRWRNTVQGAPSLWSRFKVGKMDVAPALITFRINLCLNFSRRSPLSIWLWCWDHLDLPTQALEDIARHADRLMSLSIITDTFNMMAENTTVVTTLLRQGFSQLRRLVLKGCHGYEISNMNLFRSASKLEEVKLEALMLKNTSAISLANVKRLTLKWMKSETIEAYIAVLRAMPLLEELYWIENGICILSSTSIPARPILLPSLHTLHVRYPSEICSFIRVPALTNLHIEMRDQGLDIFMQLIERSGSIIKNLYLHQCPESSTIRLLQKLHHIEEITLDLRDILKDVLLHLQWNTPNKIGTVKFLPSLQKLNVHFGGWPDSMKEVFSALTGVLESRSTPCIAKIERTDSSPVPLSDVRCFINMGYQNTSLNSKVKRLWRTGKKIGINVNARVPPSVQFWEMGDDESENDYICKALNNEFNPEIYMPAHIQDDEACTSEEDEDDNEGYLEYYE